MVDRKKEMELQQAERSDKEQHQTDRSEKGATADIEKEMELQQKERSGKSSSRRGEEKRNCINQKEERRGAAASSDGADRKQRLIMSRGADLNTSSARRLHIQGCVYVVAVLAEKLLEKLALYLLSLFVECLNAERR